MPSHAFLTAIRSSLVAAAVVIAAPWIYPIAVTAASTNPDAAAYVSFLKSPSAKPAFEKQASSCFDKSPPCGARTDRGLA
jgi:ABC-type molybdate transport system substrate-binding protein